MAAVEKKFERYFNKIEQIKETGLFKKLLEDIRKGDVRGNFVLPAFRSNYMSFYYTRGGIFEYGSKWTNKYSTHYKYLDLSEQKKHEEKYANHAKIPNYVPVELEKDLNSIYDKIKDGCAKHKNFNEAEAVSKLYKFNILNEKQDIIILDTEVAFSYKVNNEWKQDRVDLVLFNKKTQSLAFCEVKLPEDPRVCNGKVLTQLERYNEAIIKHEDNLIEQYEKYIKLCEELYEIKLHLSNKIKILPRVGLFIIGKFNNTEHEEMIKSAEIPYFQIDDSSNLKNLDELYKAVTK